MDFEATGLRSMRLPTRLDRYPAKMVSKLADRLVDRYALGAESILDPFCGSGAVLTAARRRDIRVTGLDVNPVAALFCQVKLNGFDSGKAEHLALRWLTKAQKSGIPLPVAWDAKHFWFTEGVLSKLEQLRAAAKSLRLADTHEGRALLLSYTLAIRLCSRADQRSPKPFISKQARDCRKGKHFDPYRVISGLLKELCGLYGRTIDNGGSRFLLGDVASTLPAFDSADVHSHVITSPPYINAQDYFRNFKLELYLLEGILPFRVDSIKERFIGTERGNLLQAVPADTREAHCSIVANLKDLERADERLAAVVHRYLRDMSIAFCFMKRSLQPGGCLVLVCGDNLIGGLRISTWRVLEQLLRLRGFELFDRFADPIGDRLLAPKRCGHKGLIKEEMVSAFRLS